MNISRRTIALSVLMLMSGCTGVTAVRGDCEFMLPTERDRCMRANDVNRQVSTERDKARRAAESSIPAIEKKPDAAAQ